MSEVSLLNDDILTETLRAIQEIRDDWENRTEAQQRLCLEFEAILRANDTGKGL